MTERVNSLIRRLFAPAFFLAMVLVASSAWAYGRVQWAKTTLQENKAGTQSSWSIEMKIFLDRPPATASVPVKFEFKPTVLYERYIADGDKEPKVRKVPLQDKQALIESVDLGFMDPGSGKIENRTRFGFRVSRAHGFEAGEYQVTIKDVRSGGTIGSSTRIVLEGENELIDRRAMVFASKDNTEADKKKKEEEEKKKAEQESKLASSDDPLSTQEEEKTWAEDKPERNLPIEKKKPGACGCSTVGDSTPAGTWFLPLGLGLALVARRRQKRAA